MPDIVDQMKTLLGMGDATEKVVEKVVEPAVVEKVVEKVVEQVVEPAAAGVSMEDYAKLQQQIVKQNEALLLLASRPEGQDTGEKVTAMPKRTLQVGDTKSLTERLTQELASTPAGADPFQIKYRNPNKWSI